MAILTFTTPTLDIQNWKLGITSLPRAPLPKYIIIEPIIQYPDTANIELYDINTESIAWFELYWYDRSLHW